eukprot:Blabericola_migrator_1__5936@NODE_29_length_19604_cov_95_319138_g21_i1_p5_GENE_NODE_29_length_19604_cov_95_319138_g21_i1NODE_29_length_19604_cov_95_319138_g21_i1_p5_ORF_typecomplete_len380_score71_49PI_PP_I/PF18363_1/0_019_NODE_29_length_19604_cov_95_319138_g21_i11845419593
MKQTSTKFRRWAFKRKSKSMRRLPDDLIPLDLQWPQNDAEKAALDAELQMIQTYRAFEKIVVLLQALKIHEQGLITGLVHKRLDFNGFFGTNQRCQVPCKCTADARPVVVRRRHRRFSSAETVANNENHAFGTAMENPIEQIAHVGKVMEVLESECLRLFRECQNAIAALAEARLPYQSLWLQRIYSCPKLFGAPTWCVADSQPYIPWLAFLERLLFFAPYRLPRLRSDAEYDPEWAEAFFRSSLAGTLDVDTFSTYAVGYKPTIGLLVQQWSAHLDLWLHYALSLSLTSFNTCRVAAALHTAVCILYNKGDDKDSLFRPCLPTPEYAHVLWLLIHVLMKMGHSGLRLVRALTARSPDGQTRLWLTPDTYYSPKQTSDT